MSGLTTATWNTYIDDILGTAVRTAPTTPMKLALETVAGTAAAAGTELTGYTRPTIAFTAASGAATSNSGALTIPCSTGATVVALAVYDSAGTPVRKLWGPLTSNRTVVAGDSLAFAANAITFTGTS
jgi:hypothetical protein